MPPPLSLTHSLSLSQLSFLFPTRSLPVDHFLLFLSSPPPISLSVPSHSPLLWCTHCRPLHTRPSLFTSHPMSSLILTSDFVISKLSKCIQVSNSHKNCFFLKVEMRRGGSVVFLSLFNYFIGTFATGLGIWNNKYQYRFTYRDNLYFIISSYVLNYGNSANDL